MDKALFIGMGGQSNALRELEILSNNLANVNTPGFKADYEVMKQHHLNNIGLETRVYSKLGKTYTDFRQGPILRTGRDLDVAVSGHGMFAIQSKSGREGYTRAGDFDISNDGFLTTSRGQMVLGKTGAIQIKNAERVIIGKDGTVSIKPLDSDQNVIIGKLKLVNGENARVEKGEDGLFYPVGGKGLVDDPNLMVESGSLEGSNVSPVATMIKLIDLSRNYEIHSNLIKNMADSAVQANSLLDTKA